jgi:hypothetical protein
VVWLGGLEYLVYLGDAAPSYTHGTRKQTMVSLGFALFIMPATSQCSLSVHSKVLGPHRCPGPGAY